jgi:hypothetical protein
MIYKICCNFIGLMDKKGFIDIKQELSDISAYIISDYKVDNNMRDKLNTLGMAFKDIYNKSDQYDFKEGEFFAATMHMINVLIEDILEGIPNPDPLPGRRKAWVMLQQKFITFLNTIEDKEDYGVEIGVEWANGLLDHIYS